MDKKLTKAEVAMLIAILQQQLEQMEEAPEAPEADEVGESRYDEEVEAKLMAASSSKTAAVIPVFLTACSECGSSLSTVEQQVKDSSYMVDLLPIEVVVMEIKRYGCTCPSCGREQVASYPNGLEPGRFFGKRLEALTDYIRNVWKEGWDRFAGNPVNY